MSPARRWLRACCAPRTTVFCSPPGWRRVESVSAWHCETRNCDVYPQILCTRNICTKHNRTRTRMSARSSLSGERDQKAREIGGVGCCEQQARERPRDREQPPGTTALPCQSNPQASSLKLQASSLKPKA
eukprot:3788102-Rhodomonas_salina.4